MYKTYTTVPPFGEWYYEDLRALREALASSGLMQLEYQIGTEPVTSLPYTAFRVGSEESKSALVIPTSLHGIEGHFGLQFVAWLVKYQPHWLRQLNQRGVSVLVYVLNPYGLVNLIRGDGVIADTNRGWPIPGAPLGNSDEGIPSDWIAAACPERWSPKWDTLARTLDSDSGFARYAMGGNYNNPRHVTYGGNGVNLCAVGQALLQELEVNAVFQSATHVAVLDLHTGLGGWGEGPLLSPTTNQDVADLVRYWFGQTVDLINQREGGVQVPVKGSMLQWLEYQLLQRGKTILPLGYEAGLILPGERPSPHMLLSRHVWLGHEPETPEETQACNEALLRFVNALHSPDPKWLPMVSAHALSALTTLSKFLLSPV